MTEKPLLHLVFGGEVADPEALDFTDCENLDIIGIFPNYKAALDAWRAASQAHVDDANRRYVIAHLHRLLEPGGA
ncbi:MAG: DUF4170 domain-containing protein [Rhodospirillales bacterium]